jgi:hypothetical protein
MKKLLSICSFALLFVINGYGQVEPVANESILESSGTKNKEISIVEKQELKTASKKLKSKTVTLEKGAKPKLLTAEKKSRQEKIILGMNK